VDENEAWLKDELAPKSFDEIVEYFRVMRADDLGIFEIAARGLQPKILILRDILADEPALDILDFCKMSGKNYGALKAIVRDYFESIPQSLKDALLSDLVSENPGPVQKNGRPTMVSRDREIVRYLDMLKRCSPLKLGSKLSKKDDQTAVDVIAKVLDLKPETVRDIWNRKNGLEIRG